MLGGAWYEEYISNKNSDEIYDIAIKELKKHLKLKTEPNLYEVTILPQAIPQYKIGHQKLLEKIKINLKEKNIDKKLLLIGNSYEGIGVNDAIFNARKLVQQILKKI
jgi:oxygen-dependent protoporphyrinogen oxidase